MTLADPPAGEPFTIGQLEGLALFGGLNEDALSLLCDRMETRTVDVGTVLYAEGERGRDVYVVLEGRLRVERAAVDGTPIEVGVVAPGEWVGEMALLDVMPRAATVVAVERTCLLRLDNRTLDCVYRSDLKQYALLVMNLARQLSRKLRRAEARLAAGRP